MAETQTTGDQFEEPISPEVETMIRQLIAQHPAKNAEFDELIRSGELVERQRRLLQEIADMEPDRQNGKSLES